MANSTSLAQGLGPEAMHTLCNRFFALSLDAVHWYEGTINQFLGDGFMALFGAPIAYEDHARRAVLAALGLQHRLGERQADFGLPPGEDLTVRMELYTGLVVVGSIGDNLRMDYTAVPGAASPTGRPSPICLCWTSCGTTAASPRRIAPRRSPPGCVWVCRRWA